MTDPSDTEAFLRNLGKQSQDVPSNDQDEVAPNDENDQFSFVLPTDEELREQTRKKQEHAKKKRELALNVGLFTTSGCAIPGWRIVQTLPLISARRVLGINAWQDFLIVIRDAVGGRSQTAETAFERLEAELFQELQMKAVESGGQAVVGVHVQFGEISGGGKAQLFYAAAQGTPVLMEPVPPA